MTTTSLVEFVNGVADAQYEFQNSWGGAARIWGSLFSKYIPKQHEYDNWMQAAEDKRLWGICKDPRLSDAERIVYAFSMDNALVKKEDFAAMAKALREFVEQNPREGICHLEAFAKVFDESQGDAIGLHATSICENPWIEWSEELDESVPYDIAKGEKHFFVFESLSDFAAEIKS